MERAAAYVAPHSRPHRQGTEPHQKKRWCTSAFRSDSRETLAARRLTQFATTTLTVRALLCVSLHKYNPSGHGGRAMTPSRVARPKSYRSTLQSRLHRVRSTVQLTALAMPMRTTPKHRPALSSASDARRAFFATWTARCATEDTFGTVLTIPGIGRDIFCATLLAFCF